MKDSDIKEEISKSLLRILASYEGIKASLIENDDGVDINIKRLIVYQDQNGKNCQLDDGKYIDVQIKSTTKKYASDSGETISYSLRGKNYNDLVCRRNNGNAPLILILVVFPDNKSEWLNFDLSKLLINGSSYWYRPSSVEDIIEKTTKKRIEIPKENQITSGFFEKAFSNELIWN